jgi:hypothetical protein
MRVLTIWVRDALEVHTGWVKLAPWTAQAKACGYVNAATPRRSVPLVEIQGSLRAGFFGGQSPDQVHFANDTY